MGVFECVRSLGSNISTANSSSKVAGSFVQFYIGVSQCSTRGNFLVLADIFVLYFGEKYSMRVVLKSCLRR